MTVDEILRGAAADLHADVRATVDAPAALDTVVATRPARRPPWLALAAAVLVVAVVAGVAVAVLRDEAEEVATEVPAPTTEPAGDGPAPGVFEGLPITATPDEGLADGDTVRVTVEGLEDDPLAQVELALCTGDAMTAAPDPRRCDFPDGGVATAEIAGGRAEADIVVDRILRPSSGEASVDCAAGTGLCAIGVAVNRGVPEGVDEEPLGPQLVGLVGVAFAPVEERQPRLSVSPDVDLHHGQVVTISGEGFVGTVRQAVLCTSEEDGEPACTGIPLTARDTPGDGVRTADGGRFSVEVPIYRSFPSFTGPVGGAVRFDPDTPIVDCLEVGCELVVEGEDGRASPPVALRFDPDVAPPEPPTLAVSPTSGLRPGDPVHVTIGGLVPGEEIWLSACQLVGGRCTAGTTLDPVTADAEGAVDTTIAAVDPASYGVDCTRPDTCAVSIGDVFQYGNPLLGVVSPVPVQFAPP